MSRVLGMLGHLALVATIAVGCASDSGDSAAPANAPTSSTSSTVAAAPVASPGCDRPSNATGDDSAPNEQPVDKDRRTIEMDGNERWYLFTSTPHDQPVPLVLDFHGLSEGAEFHSASDGWNELAGDQGFAVAFPQGTGQPVSWNITSSGENPDLDFVDAMIKRIGEDNCIDTSRIYATGMSNGALMSSVLGCTRASTFAAVAPVAGVTFPEDCAPGMAVPLITFHGTADPILLFNGGVGADVLAGALSGQAVSTTTAPVDLEGPGYPQAVADWAASNGCGGHHDEQVTDSVIHRVWECPPGAEVEFYIVEGGGHTWPGSDALTNPAIASIVGPTTSDIDATALTWEFFRSHQRSS